VNDFSRRRAAQPKPRIQSNGVSATVSSPAPCAGAAGVFLVRLLAMVTRVTGAQRILHPLFGGGALLISGYRDPSMAALLSGMMEVARL